MALAVPLILANVTTPILGLVDTAILGRMDEVHYFAGAAIGSLIVTQLYWICGFLKMSVTGLSAQTKNLAALSQLEVLVQGVGLSVVLVMIIALLQSFVLDAGLFFAQASPVVAESTRAYFTTRIWGAPAALLNLVMIGWLVGQQKTGLVLLLQVVINVANIAGSLLFVYVFDWGVEGVAAATVCAEYLMLFCAIAFIKKRYAGQSNLQLSNKSAQAKSVNVQQIKQWLAVHNMRALLSLNGHIFVRNMALQFVIAFITLRGAQFGMQAAAVNAIIMQFFTLIALGLDGIANGVEALVGEQKGNKDVAGVHSNVKIGLFWSSVVAVIYAIAFYLLDSPIVNLLTHHSDIKQAMNEYSTILVLLPLLSHWCFLLDGVFVGLSKGAAMRNTMLVSTCLVFVPVWYAFNTFGNIALWFAMLSFLSSRGIAQGAYYYYWYYLKAGTPLLK